MSGHPLNQAVIAQVLNDLRDGQLRRSLEMGFTEEDMRVLQDPKSVSLLLNTPVRWTSAHIDSDVMHRLLNRVHEIEKEIVIIDEMLRLGASSKMIADVFGLNQREVAFRKRVLEIDKKQGRWHDVSQQKNHELWHEWKAKIAQYELDPDNLMDMAKVCMILAKNHEIPMAMIWSAMEKWTQAIEEQKQAKEQTQAPAQVDVSADDEDELISNFD